MIQVLMTRILTKVLGTPKDSSRTALHRVAAANAIWLAQLAQKKKAKDVVILNVGKTLFITNYFVIISGKTQKQNQALAQEMKEQAKMRGLKLFGWEGYQEGSWILLDFGSVIVHIFMESLRSFYDLEFLWSEAPRVKWQAKSLKD